MNKLRSVRLLLPILLLAACEAAFRSGCWEPFAAPNSHAGTSVRVKRALAEFSGPIDFVTLGSSRAVYGLDHQLIAERAASHGYTHANLSMAGAHWLSVNTLVAWLRRQRPGLQGGVIALGLSDLTGASNGNHELAIVTPLQTEWLGSAELHQRFRFEDRGSWGAASVLWQYRSDISDLALRPVRRRKDLRWYRKYGAHSLFHGWQAHFDVCGLDWDTLARCNAITPVNADQEHLLATCRLHATSQSPPDWRGYIAGSAPPAQVELREQRRLDIRNIIWPRPPILILMPLTQHWRDEILPRGMREYAHALFDPLVAEGRLHLLDYSEFFDRDGSTRCDVFWDIFHQNTKGARELTEALLPELGRLLYAGPVRSSPGP